MTVIAGKGQGTQTRAQQTGRPKGLNLCEEFVKINILMGSWANGEPSGCGRWRGKWWEGRERRNFVLLHAISTNDLEDLFPLSRASPPAQQTRAFKFPWLSHGSVTPLSPSAQPPPPPQQSKINHPQAHGHLATQQDRKARSSAK